MKAVRAIDEPNREQIRGSLLAWWDKKPGCSDQWLKKALRKVSDFRTVDAVIQQHEDEFMRTDQWRYLRLRVLLNKVRLDAD